MISMKKVNYAAIDIGSNAVRLLIKCVNEENAPELMSKGTGSSVFRYGWEKTPLLWGVISTEKRRN